MRRNIVIQLSQHRSNRERPSKAKEARTNTKHYCGTSNFSAGSKITGGNIIELDRNREKNTDVGTESSVPIQ